jgi:two-component system, NtrC family, nitrogen regulation response regulator NtrX
VPVVIISGHGNIEIAVAAIKQGAYDFIEKPFNIDQLMVVVGRAMETSRLRRENVELRRRDLTSADLIGAVGRLPHAEGAAGQGDQIERARDADRPFGAGKEMAARYIHANSNRASAALRHGVGRHDRTRPDGRGAVRPRNAERGVEKGLLEQAHGGVVYLDEVADMPPGTQSKILRVLVDQSSPASAAPTRCGSICGSSRPPRAICAARSPPGGSGRNCMTG